MELKMVFPLRSVLGLSSKPLCSDGTEAISNRLGNQQAGSAAAQHPGRLAVLKREAGGVEGRGVWEGEVKRFPRYVWLRRNTGDHLNPETRTPVEEIKSKKADSSRRFLQGGDHLVPLTQESLWFNPTAMQFLQHYKWRTSINAHNPSDVYGPLLCITY